MSINGVSFGSIIAISGKPNRVNRVNKKLLPQAENGKLMMKDVTYHFKNLSSQGMLANLAQSGEMIEIYITGEDYDKANNGVPGWDTLPGLISNRTLYYNANKMPVNTVVNNIYKNC